MRTINPIPHDDQETIREICKDRPGWSAHETIWLQAASDYKLAGGSPWVIKPSVFSPDVRSDLEKLYESRRNSGYVKRIRDYPFPGSCPLCGSLGGGSVDHFLPKAIFPEFSIYSLNLVPACFCCNSGEKGTKYRGENAPARFAHPYFDGFVNQPILFVTFGRPYEAVEIVATPNPALSLSGEQFEIALFHMKELLGNAFGGYVRNLWSTLPKTVSDSYKGLTTELKPADTRAKVESLLKDNQNTYGLNSWPAGFYRGVLADPAVIDYVTEKGTDALSW